MSLVTRCRQPLLLTSAPAAPGTPSITRQARAVVQKLRDEAGSILECRHSGRQRYSFLPPDSCAEDSEEEEEVKYQRYKELKRAIGATERGKCKGKREGPPRSPESPVTFSK